MPTAVFKIEADYDEDAVDSKVDVLQQRVLNVLDDASNKLDNWQLEAFDEVVGFINMLKAKIQLLSWDLGRFKLETKAIEGYLEKLSLRLKDEIWFMAAILAESGAKIKQAREQAEITDIRVRKIQRELRKALERAKTLEIDNIRYLDLKTDEIEKAIAEARSKQAKLEKETKASKQALISMTLTISTMVGRLFRSLGAGIEEIISSSVAYISSAVTMINATAAALAASGPVGGIQAAIMFSSALILIQTQASMQIQRDNQRRMNNYIAENYTGDEPFA